MCLRPLKEAISHFLPGTLFTYSFQVIVKHYFLHDHFGQKAILLLYLLISGNPEDVQRTQMTWQILMFVDLDFLIKCPLPPLIYLNEYLNPIGRHRSKQA